MLETEEKATELFEEIPTSSSKREHVHGKSCGHTVIQHGDHVGYLQDGELHCKVPEEQKFVTHAIDDGSADVWTPKCQRPVDFNTGDSSPKRRKEWGSGGHKHGPYCGHERVWHKDHFDFLVKGQLQHDHGDHYDVHGQLKIAATVRQVDSYDTAQLHRRSNISPKTKIGDKQPKKKVNCDADSLRFVAMLFLTGGYMLVELVWGLSVGSLALVADAMHMFSDLLALVIGFHSMRMSRKERTNEATYGFSRMEVIGALINGVFLLSVCLSIAMEAAQRFFGEVNHKLADGAIPLIIVASIGLAINILGLCIFGSHGHSHGGHGGHGGQREGADHGGHGGHGHSVGGLEGEEGHGEEHDHSHGSGADEACKELVAIHLGDAEDEEEAQNKSKGGKKKKGPRSNKTKNLNIEGVFLHVLGDALGSVAVIISGLVIYFFEGDDKLLADPICSLVITFIITYGTLPLVKKCISALLQKVPQGIDLETVRRELLQVEGVEEVHDLHVWALTTNKIIGSLHVVVAKDYSHNFMEVSDKMKLAMHKHGIHSTTIQPEYAEITPGSTSRHYRCHEPICPSAGCVDKQCCTEDLGH